MDSHVASGAGDTYPGHYFRASSPYSLVNWRLSDNFVYKLFPDVLAYHLLIAIVVAMSLMSHASPALRLRLHRRVWVRINFHHAPGRFVFSHGHASVAKHTFHTVTSPLLVLTL